MTCAGVALHDPGRRRQPMTKGAMGLTLAATLVSIFATPAVAAPAIRTSPANPVPACVTPERLMAFLKTRNPALPPRYAPIARWYKHHGEAWRVRWDYAFFQMAIETNYLSYRRPDGRPADVSPRQNNFAGIGATGGGVPGDSFADTSAGVEAQIQHLVAYSGERVANPIAPRTQLKQDDIIAASARLSRIVRFSDLAGRWAADRAYGRTIEAVAAEYREAYCANSASAKPFSPPMLLAGPEPAARVAAFRRQIGEPSLIALPKPLSPPAAATKPAVVRTIWRQKKPGDVPPAIIAANAADKPVPAPVPANRRTAAAAPAAVPQPPALPPATAPAAPDAGTLASQQIADEAVPPAIKSWSKLASAFSFAPVAPLAGTCRIAPPATLSGATTLVSTVTPSGTELALVPLADAGSAGGTALATFDTAAAAIAKAKEYCPSARQARADEDLARR